MKCPVCGLEMIVYQVTEDGPAFVCRNRRCAAFDRRLQKKAAAEPREKNESE